MSRVINLTDAEDDRDHIPLIVDSNTQVPSRIKALIDGTGEDPGPVLAEMAKRLEANGAEALAMPCNTAHHYAPVIEAAVRIPLLNMIDLSVERVLASAGKGAHVGLLASPTALQTRVFDRAFSRAGLATTAIRDQARMLSAVREIKVDSTSMAARNVLRDAAEELARAGSDVLVIGCSEFSIIADAIPGRYTVVDTAEVLAQSVVSFASGSWAPRVAEIAQPVSPAEPKG
ncbi:MAG: amino acid racemase, partial [Pseudomonadota bacterium]